MCVAWKGCGVVHKFDHGSNSEELNTGKSIRHKLHKQDDHYDKIRMLISFVVSVGLTVVTFAPSYYKKRLFQNKSKFITEDQFVKHMNIKTR